MARVPSNKALSKESFPDEVKDWIGVMLVPLNQFMTSTVNALQSSLTFGANIQGQENLLDFTYNSAADFPQSFKNALPVRPSAVSMVSASEDSLPVILAFAWQMNASGGIEISNIVKLTTGGVSALNVGSRYRLVFRSTP